MTLFERFFKGRNLVPSSVANNSATGDLEVLTSDSKLHYHNGSTSAIVPTATSTDTLTNKTINGANNTLIVRAASDITGILPNANTTADSADTNNAIVLRDNSGNFAAGTITATLSGTATNVSGVVAIANGGTNSSTALTSGMAIVSTGGKIVEAAATTSTEIGYVHGVTSAIQTQLDAIVALTFPSGVILPYGGASAPSGFLLCDGSSVLRASFPTLFSAIGTSFGSVDGTHFNIPQMARRVPMGAGGSGSGVIGNTVGSTGGEEAHALTAAENGTHTHIQDAHTHPLNINDSGVSDAGLNSVNFLNNSTSSSQTIGRSTSNSQNSAIIASTTATNQNSGSGTPHNTIQPSIVVNYIIKT